MEDKQIFEKWEEFKALLKSTNREGITEFIKWLDSTDFKFAPASTQYHNSFKGGLLAHSLNVYYAMYDFGSMLDFLEIPQESIIITALLHDICKIDCYTVSYRNTKNENGEWIKVPYYQFDEVEPLGHAEKSIMYIYEHGLTLTKVERAMIRNHMGFTVNDDERRVNKLFRICPQSLVLSYADMLATFVTEGYDMPERFKQKMIGRNIGESLKLLKEKQTKIVVDGTEYKLAPTDSVVDDEKIITIHYNGNAVKVYAPYKDGLPF